MNSWIKTLSIALVFLVSACVHSPHFGSPYPDTQRKSFMEEIHGVTVNDPYRWLENGDDPEVVNWTKNQIEYTRSKLDGLSRREWLIKTNRDLLFYDDETPPSEVQSGQRTFFWRKKKDAEHWTYNTRLLPDAPSMELLNPNTWNDRETLEFVEPSFDGKYIAFGKAHGGDENAQTYIMEVETKRILPDKLKGWKHQRISWLPDNSGFYYSANPLKGTVSEGEEFYWHSAYFHKLGTDTDHDIKVFSHDSIKNCYHQVIVSEEGQSIFLYRMFRGKSEIYYKRLGNPDPPIPIVTGFDGFYTIQEIEGRLFFWTNHDAPMGKVWTTDINHPEQEHWKLFLPETTDRLKTIALTAGKIYAVYLQDVHTQIKVYSIDGDYLRDVQLPDICSASVYGYWLKPRAKIRISSYTKPSTTYKYDFNDDSLEVYHASPIKIDTSDYLTEQIFYSSLDGTTIPMFLIHKKELEKNREIPVLLYGYGGFGGTMTPHFSIDFLNWLEAGGMVAVANIRGGGEYGEKWHEAGKKDQKQNVFDDFIAAAEWLIENKYTNSGKLVIKGESNGGLLVGAVFTQRPDLFKAVYCGVPLLDMVRYHLFGIANLWEDEYGSADDPEAFKYLLAYSPYHQIKEEVDYPAILVQASCNDARVDPFHARKMVAGLQAANPDGNPALLLIWEVSGHGGGIDLTTRLNQRADYMSFLMNQVGL